MPPAIERIAATIPPTRSKLSLEIPMSMILPKIIPANTSFAMSNTNLLASLRKSFRSASVIRSLLFFVFILQK